MSLPWPPYLKWHSLPISFQWFTFLHRWHHHLMYHISLIYFLLSLPTLLLKYKLCEGRVLSGLFSWCTHSAWACISCLTAGFEYVHTSILRRSDAPANVNYICVSTGYLQKLLLRSKNHQELQAEMTSVLGGGTLFPTFLFPSYFSSCN